MAFWLPNKVVTIHWDHSTAVAYLCTHDETASSILSRLACHIWNLDNLHGINLLPAFLPTHSNMETDYHK